MACGGLESPVWRDNMAKVGIGAAVGVTELESLGGALGEALGRDSDFSEITEAALTN